jgi:tRNA(Arg) A34 adenosine deaminase TadA
MPCPVCAEAIGSADHRKCVFALLKAGTIKSVPEWEAMCAPKTIRKGRIRAVLPKE